MRETQLRCIFGVIFGALIFAMPAADAKPSKKAFDQLRGSFKFGMTSKQVRNTIKKQVHKRFAKQLEETTDVYKQDKIRTQMKAASSQVEHVVFDGRKTGWDVSIIDDQYRHKLGESMMVYWENTKGKNQRRFFFFYKDRLYKMVVALNAQTLSETQLNFAEFQAIVENLYGSGRVVFKTDNQGQEVPSRVEWSTGSYLAQAIDKQSFYGAFCLVIADKKRLRTVLKVRKKHPLPKEKSDRITEQVTSSGNDDPSFDDNAHAIDKIINSKQ